MAYNNPPVPWSELERRLSDRRYPERPRGANGGDSPAWSRKRDPYEAPALVRSPPAVSYAELHCHSNFSFLDGASNPEDLVEEAVRLGLEALALTDHDGFSGVVRFAEAARAVGLPTVFGAELTLDLPAIEELRERPGVGEGPHAREEGGVGAPPGGAKRPGVGEGPHAREEGGVGAPPGGAKRPANRRAASRGEQPPDPPGRHLVVLARDPIGYARLATAISEAQLRGRKGAPSTTLAALAEVAHRATITSAATHGRPDPTNHWTVLTGCRKGTVPAALLAEGPAAAERELYALVDAFGREHVAVELWDHGDPLDSARNDALVELAVRAGVEVVATNNVHYATPAARRLATALAAVRARRSLDEIDGWLPAAASAHLRSGAEQARRFARYPGVVERAAELGRAAAFDLALVAPRLPPFPCPSGHTEMSWLCELTRQGALERYGPPDAPRHPRAYEQIEHELAVIEALGFPGYFLVVWDIVQFCRRADIYCQGRGSAANSAVCYALGITNADAVGLGLLFERFLSPERDGPPDIDIDIESDRREEVIQYVYETHGRHHAAQVCNVITYRARSAVRDMARALGYGPGQQDAYAKQLDRWGGLGDAATDSPSSPPADVLELARQVEHFPRHLGIHSGGMVICDRPVIEVCPVEWASMEGRTVLQWDKEDCAATGLVKFDLLGLGMLSALHYAVDLVREHEGIEIDLATIPQEDAVYDMLCRADSIGVFQVESRAQMATLPRLKPRTFYDLVVEVALIRPGPIQGGSVHPYIRRRNGEEPVTYLHPLLENALAKTLGVPLFQEQLMQMAIDVAGFTAAEADQLRQAMGAKRSRERMERLRARLFAGMAERGVTGDTAERIWDKLAAFANFGFPESHSVSFAYLVYSSSWIKLHHPAAFCAALLNAQPMGFYSPHTLVQDARRHGVEVRTPDLNRSLAGATLEPAALEGRSVDFVDAVSRSARPEPAAGRAANPPMASQSSSLGSSPAVRLGLGSVRTIGAELAERIVVEREDHGPYRDMEDLKRRVGLPLPALEALATAGAFGCFDRPDGDALDRRGALWGAGAVAQTGDEHLAGIVTGVMAPTLPAMTARDEAFADLWATGVAPDGHPTVFERPHLDELGVVPADGLRSVPDGDKVLVAGVVTHRQRPATAGGTTFVNLEDETGLINVIVSQGCWLRYRDTVRGEPALLIRGRLERTGEVVNVIAERIDPLPLGAAGVRSRDFR